ncbi:Undecaprenyl phosphate N,N'-diacetylbacillosamine 1-phosphate transferase [Dyadobacter sp. CECT 9623]|uniref:Undecaprenyl phosphate N,N'-diacetylbacillosamine 1-phosphate transferase n=1 Tax=Dyadobacter linearis TaxID=2823330 RepID=A0ABM8UXF2_9BACT|nr:sugar transferase [Dyadobacter sp. CECT 9623]CAG5074325.1 Undecaprenyl phosphate N,N'-diacetylbacillosamine 1-phosphate transferase [Dyadobacter sp. CECT 9623]
MYKKSGKRILDLIIAAAGIFISLPLFVLITLVVCIDSRGRPFFLQKRPGLNEKLFTLVKLRTMRNNGEVTAFGRILRITSFDEIPQLWNVLRGEMSIVGPRPLLVQYLPLYNEFQKQRHTVLPGITGLAQVNGRNEISWQEKFEYDVAYVRDLSLELDLEILGRTFSQLLDRKNVKPLSGLPTDEFKGN